MSKNIIIKRCPECGHIGRYTSDYNKCFCGKDSLIETQVTDNKYHIIYNVSSDRTFLNAMVDLKEKDPIEFQLKMSQFKTQVQQQESSKVQMDIRPKCPTCGSTDLSKVSTMSKAGSVIMFGLLSQKVKKTWHCNKCKYEW